MHASGTSNFHNTTVRFDWLQITKQIVGLYDDQ